MATYVEGVVWYLILIDCIVYNIFSWTYGKKHTRTTHWVSEHFPLSKFMGLMYLFLVVWTGFALYRMQLLGFTL